MDQKNKNKDYSELFTATLLETFKILRENHPDVKYIRKVHGKFIRTERPLYIEYTLKNMNDHIDYICSQDTSIFTDDYSKKPLYLIVGLNFKQSWWDNLSNEIQEELFIQLQLLYIYGSRVLKTNKGQVRDMIENLKIQRDLEEEVAQAEAREKEGGQFNLENVFGKNNPMLELVTEVMSDPELRQKLNLPEEGETVDNPVELLRGIFQPEKLTDLMKTLERTLKVKMAEKDLKEEDLKAGSQKATENMLKQLGNNPMLKSLGIDKMLSNISQAVDSNTVPSGIRGMSQADEFQEALNTGDIQQFVEQVHRSIGGSEPQFDKSVEDIFEQLKKDS